MWTLPWMHDSQGSSRCPHKRWLNSLLDCEEERSMELIKVDSSMIYAFGYDEQQQVLEVVFKRTGVYRYRNVPKEVYQQLLQADSKGSYMRDLIIDMYPTERVG